MAALHHGRAYMIRFRDRGARGRHQGAQIDAHHSFSFADYNDPKHMGFRALRVLNKDRVVPGAPNRLIPHSARCSITVALWPLHEPLRGLVLASM
jgi:redox-sensitive bicupin YhaK (pirin superfamily)